MSDYVYPVAISLVLAVLLNERQAGVAIEGALKQKVCELQRLAVDTHGFTYFAMAAAKLLGFDLAPRLADLASRKLHLRTALSFLQALSQWSSAWG